MLRLAGEGLLHCPRCGKPEVEASTKLSAPGAVLAFRPITAVDLHGLASDSPPAEGDFDRAVALAAGCSGPRSAGSDHRTSLRCQRADERDRDEFDAEIRDIADRFGIDSGGEPKPATSLETAADVGRPSTPPSILDRLPTDVPPRNALRNRGTESFRPDRSRPSIGFRWFDADEQLVAARNTEPTSHGSDSGPGHHHSRRDRRHRVRARTRRRAR